jgi:hypothetical protein
VPDIASAQFRAVGVRHDHFLSAQRGKVSLSISLTPGGARLTVPAATVAGALRAPLPGLTTKKV